MIRLASCNELPALRGTEAAVRIRSLAFAYGENTAIVRFYTDDHGGYMSVMDGAGTLYVPEGVNEEWLSFLSFVPDVHTLRTNGDTGVSIGKRWGSAVKKGVLMRYNGDKPRVSDTTSAVRLDDLYLLLCAAFPSMPPFDVWYVDVSHRIRHGHCRIACVCENGRPVSTAMTVAQTEDEVLLGAVATDAQWRRRGYAARCVLSLVRQFYGRQTYIAPVDATAERLYSRLGFTPFHTWAEVIR